MTCEHPRCTGVHDKNRSYVAWCPSTRERHRITNRAAQARYKSTVKGMLTDARRNATMRGA